MKKLLKTTSLMAVLPLAIGLASLAQANDTELLERLSTLEKELQDVKAELKKEAATPGVQMKNNTTFTYGGFIKANAMLSSYSDAERASATIGDEILVPSTIGVGDGSNGGKTRLDTHVKTSRFYFKTATQTDRGQIKTHVELDFLTGDGNERISNSVQSRLRHAFVAWDYAEDTSLLVGQTWSTFFNVGALPEAVDFIGPTSGTIFNRQAQLRWTKKLNGGSLMIAAENPSTSLLDGGSGISGTNFDDNKIPDLVARYNGKAGDFSYTLAGISREIAYDNGAADDSKMGYGFSLSGKWVFENGDDLKFMANYGHLGRYLALQPFRDAAVEADGSIDLIESSGGFIAYRHKWSDKLRSTILFATSSADNPASVGVDVTSKVSNASLNLIYSPTPKLAFGAEYISAERELESGVDGDLSRLQFMAKFSF